MSSSDLPALPDENRRPAAVPSTATGNAADAHPTEDLPFPLPPDWFERKAAAQAAAKARETAEAEAAVAAAAAQALAAQHEAAAGRPIIPTMSREEAQRLAAHAAQAASSASLHDAAGQHERTGNDFMAQGRWLPAASEFDAAARKAATPEEGKRLSELATRARARPRFRRLLLTTLMSGLAMGAIAGAGIHYSAWLMGLFHGDAAKQADARTSDGVSVQQRVDAAATMGSLTFAAGDDATPWSVVAKQARHALAQAGISLAAVQAILEKASAQERQEAKDFATVDQSRLSNPAAALDAAATFRTAHPRAQDYRARLPLPGRLLVRGCAASLAHITIDDATMACDQLTDESGLVFCRSQLIHTHITVACHGYTPVAIDIPGSDARDEKVVTATLAEIPVWRLHAPPRPPAWIALRPCAGLLVVAQPASVQAVATATGHVVDAFTVTPDSLDGLPSTPFTWTGMLESPPTVLWMTTSSGALIQGTVTATGFASPSLVLVGTRPVVALGQGSLVFQLNKHVWFNISQPRERLGVSTLPPNADQLTPAKTTAQLTASSAGSSLWTEPVTAVLQPYLHVVGEAIVVVDDLALQVFDQDGKTQRRLEWPTNRSGPIFAFTPSSGEILVSTCGSQVALFSNPLAAPTVTLLPGVTAAVAAHGDFLLCHDALAISLWQLQGHGFSMQWSMPLAGSAKPVWFALSAADACYCDQYNAVHIIDLAQHRDIHTILLDTPLLTPPLLTKASVILADRFGQVRAYTLAAP